MVLSADQFSAQMIAQLRLLDPSVSAEIGTPERKIIDTVAQALADNQVDLTGLAGATDIDSKFGSNLDQFTALFGFGRQGATFATGYVVYSRNTPAPSNILIPQGATIQSNTMTSQGQFLQYVTTVGGTIVQGATSSAPIPVRCSVSGSSGNAAVNTLTNPVGVPLVSGVTSVTNPAPITHGADAESDDAYKVRFKNTVFRNLAGTEDQYLALAVSTAYTTKANVIGPISRYHEYIQIPDVDDAGYLGGVQYTNGATLPNGSVIAVANSGGAQNQWTTSLSSIPYAQDIYVNPPPAVSNGILPNQYFFRRGTDFNFNYPPLYAGDTEREIETSTTAPNFTFLNVYNPTSPNPLSGLIAATPQSILLSEFSYLSSASRNSIKHNIYNCVDVYVDGSNPTSASCVFLPGAQAFTVNPTSPLFYDNFRRDGEPTVRPHPGNFFTPLFQSPLTSLPNTISVTVGSTVYNYYLGYHYWLVHEYDILGGSIRARDGIEWSNFLNADTTGAGAPGVQPSIPYQPIAAPYNPGAAAPGTTTINTLGPSQQVEVDGYGFDANITVLQATLEDSKQITTDVLAHSASNRYFKIDATVVYDSSANPSTTNVAISAGLQAYFKNLSFGGVILLSDLLSVVQQTPGVSNVRWSNDLPSVPNYIRVYETDVNGFPLHTPYVDRSSQGSSSSIETQRIYFPGNLSDFAITDTFTLSWKDPGNTFTTGAIILNGMTASSLQAAIRAAAPASGMYNGITVVSDGWSSNTGHPITSYQLIYSANGTPYLPIITPTVTNSTYAHDNDIYLYDNELPSIPTGLAPNDSVAGAIIRPRAQGTFVRPGIG